MVPKSVQCRMHILTNHVHLSAYQNYSRVFHETVFSSCSMVWKSNLQCRMHILTNRVLLPVHIDDRLREERGRGVGQVCTSSLTISIIIIIIVITISVIRYQIIIPNTKSTIQNTNQNLSLYTPS